VAERGGAERPRSLVLRARNLTRGSEVAGQVEVADSFGTRFRGLMGRASLLPGGGLWLTGTSNIHMFFMRFPIDLVYLDHLITKTQNLIRRDINCTLLSEFEEDEFLKKNPDAFLIWKEMSPRDINKLPGPSNS